MVRGGHACCTGADNEDFFAPIFGGAAAAAAAGVGVGAGLLLGLRHGGTRAVSLDVLVEGSAVHQSARLVTVKEEAHVSDTPAPR